MKQEYIITVNEEEYVPKRFYERLEYIHDSKKEKLHKALLQIEQLNEEIKNLNRQVLKWKQKYAENKHMEMAQTNAMPSWIDLSEYRPMAEGLYPVIFRSSKGLPLKTFAYYFEEENIWRKNIKSKIVLDVTHWMPYL